MTILGITGGIATGKSTFARELLSRANVSFFDTDRCARELLQSEDVEKELRSTFGQRVFSGDGRIDRERLRNIVFADVGGRLALEKILHPRIRKQWLREAREARQEGRAYVVDIPLLYETQAEVAFDRVVVVACGMETQWQRLITERKLPERVATQILAAQMPLAEKIARANHVVWSDAPQGRLADQARLLLQYLRWPAK